MFHLFARHGLESNVLRFVAYMATDNPIDRDRKFIVSYFLSDDTIAVFEPPLRNSGTNVFHATVQTCAIYALPPYFTCTLRKVLFRTFKNEWKDIYLSSSAQFKP